jgi:hypothetical protein
LTHIAQLLAPLAPHAWGAAVGRGGGTARYHQVLWPPDRSGGLGLACAAGYLNLLSQLTKVGDYDEATFKGKQKPASQPQAPCIVLVWRLAAPG